MKGQNARQPLPVTDADTPTRGMPPMLESRNQWAYPRCAKNGPLTNEDWTPGIQGLDPQCMKTRSLRTKTTRPSIPETRTKDFVGFRTSQDTGLRGIRDFMGFKTSRGLGLCGIQDFAGLRTSWDLGLRRKQELYTPRTRDLVLWCSLREHKLSG